MSMSSIPGWSWSWYVRRASLIGTQEVWSESTLTPGTIGVVDHDTVDSSNLHRQVLHTSPTVGMNKARSAATAMNA
jgi:molybdopterin/thiamine biosynthesis adenylyltransferase